MIGFAAKCLHEPKQEPKLPLVHQESRLPYDAVHFKFDAWLSSLADAVTTTREVISDGWSNFSPCKNVVLVPPARGEDKGDWKFEDMP